MNKKIIIADDDAPIVDAMKMILELEGYVVTTLLDGGKLLQMQDNFPDLFLLDMWMSGEDGKEIAMKLKNQEKTKHIPIMLVSANKDVAAAAKQVGVEDYLPKPFEMTELLAKVKKLLKE